jgi:histidinol-phosphatase
MMRPMSAQDVVDLGRALEVAKAAVEAGGAAAMVHFRQGVAVEKKPDRTPVTVADREAEAAIVSVIRDAFPDHAILGEETGRHEGSVQARWIVDPIDGTRGFTRGGAFWGPLVALEVEGEVVAGAMALPAEGRSYWAARGHGAFRDGARLRVSAVDRWEDATLSLGELPHVLAPERSEAVLSLMRTADSARCYGDLAGCAMLLDGRADAWIEAGVQVWDLAPLRILVEEAGGRFTDFAGTRALDDGTAVATNGHLHEHVLALLRA